MRPRTVAIVVLLYVVGASVCFAQEAFHASNETPRIAPTSGSKFTKIPACDAGTRFNPQFHSTVVHAVASNPCSATAIHTRLEQCNDGMPHVAMTTAVKIKVPIQ